MNQAFGTQIKHHGKQHIQFSGTLNPAHHPTLTIEMTTSENPWKKNTTVKMQLAPETELLDLCLFLHPKKKLSKTSQFQTNRSTVKPKVLTIRVEDNTSSLFFIGLIDNTTNQKYHRVFGVKQMLTLRLIAFSRLAKVYDCSVADLYLMLETYM